MDKGTAHLAVYDTLTDSEVGHLLVELHTGALGRQEEWENSPEGYP